MDLEEKLIFQRQQARLDELESWLAMLIVRHGYATGTGFRYDLSTGAAEILRAQLPRMEVAVSITYDMTMGLHVMDAL